MKQRARSAAGPSTGPEWLAMLGQATLCCHDLDGWDDAAAAEVEHRRMTLAHAVRDATPAVFVASGDYAATQAAKAFLEIARAFAASREAALRAQLAPSVTALATFLDSKLHAVRQRAFEAAHHGRPEIHG